LHIILIEMLQKFDKELEKLYNNKGHLKEGLKIIMKKDEIASISIKKVIFFSVIFILILGVSVLAGNVKLNTIKIKYSNNHEITVITSKTKISDILAESHITIAENEIVKPGLDEEIAEEKTINIEFKSEKEIEKAETIETAVDEEIILASYTNITEAIITVKEEIPFETITKDVSNGSESTTNRVIQSGRNGLKETTYKVTYKDGGEIAREELTSKIVKEPVNKIVQVQTKTSRSNSRVSGISGQSGVYKVTAYCACISCCGKTDGITASGTHATAGRTIAAPKTFAFGTKVVIDGVTYTVEDRGGAIQGNRIDVYMNSHSEALRWGVRYLPVEVL